MCSQSAVNAVKLKYCGVGHFVLFNGCVKEENVTIVYLSRSEVKLNNFLTLKMWELPDILLPYKVRQQYKGSIKSVIMTTGKIIEFVYQCNNYTFFNARSLPK